MVVRLRTTEPAVFTATADWADAPTYASFFIGTEFLGFDDFSAPEVLENGDSYTIPSGTQYNFTFTPAQGSGSSNTAGDAALAAIMNAASQLTTRLQVTITLHDGNPGTSGTAGTANELDASTNQGYARQTVDFEVVAV